jgi:hypothetical protein
MGLLLLVLACACTKTESTSVLTSGVSAELTVVGYGDGRTIAWGRLKVGDPGSSNFLDIIGDDRLEANTGASTQRMSKGEFLGLVSYRADFKGSDLGGTKYTIAFERNVDDGAPNSHCTLPAPFKPASIAEGSSISRANGTFDITWGADSAGDKMRWQASGTCIERASGSIAGDPGALRIDGIKAAQNKSAETCDVTVEIFRERPGTLDASYGKGGSITCEQTRSIKFKSAP